MQPLAPKDDPSDQRARAGMGPPVLIWTMQRTGGTNLAVQLSRFLHLPSTEHEPFNVDRVYGSVTTEWLKHRDRDALVQRLDALCALPTLLKHCVDTTPNVLSTELAKASARAGFKHLFLYRRNSLHRLVSLQIAKQTGFWGPRSKTERSVNHQSLSSLDIADLIAREETANKILQDVWRVLRLMGIRPIHVAFEEIYEAAFDASKVKLEEIFQTFGGTHPEIEEFVKSVLKEGKPTLETDYSAIPGVSSLILALRAVRPFSPEQ